MPKLSGQPIICDSSSLISLTDSCFVHALYFLKNKFGGKFIIPPSVESECVENPRRIAAHAMHALRLKRAINDGIIEIVPTVSQRTIQEIRFFANNLYYAAGTPIRLLHEGESEVLAIANETEVKNILMDERTTRMLVESPETLLTHLEHELHRPITINDENMQSFSRFTRGFRFFRSSEIMLMASEKGFFADYGGLEREAIQAALYKLKYAGCAVGFSEIDGYFAKKPSK